MGKSIYIWLALGLILWGLLLHHNYKKDLVRSRLKANLQKFRQNIQMYRENQGDYAVLRDSTIDFWTIENNQYLWLHSFKNGSKPLPKLACEEFRKEAKFYLEGKRVTYKEYFLRDFFNPITGKFDWLAEDASGTLYSPNMPDSVLVASPPIRVMNIRCPLTASDPPYFTDFTKW